MRLVRHRDQDERENDGAVLWDTMIPKLLKTFGDRGAREFSHQEWLHYVYEGSNKTRFEYSESSEKNPWRIFMQFILHPGRIMIAPELMGHIAIPHGWKEFTFHRGCSHNANSILETGLVAGGREYKEGRQTIFFTLLDPYGEIPDEDASSDDPSVPRKVHYHSNWKKTLRCYFLRKIAILGNEVQCNNRTQSCAGSCNYRWSVKKEIGTSTCAKGNT